MRIRFVALLALVAAGPALAKPQIKDVQETYGQLGPQRKSSEYMPGDEMYLRFTITGARTDDQGRIKSELRLTLTDSAGKVVLKQASALNQLLAFGGGQFPGKASLELGAEFAPGEYEFTVEFADLLADESASFKHKFTCKPVAFSLVGLRFFQDKEGRVPARVGGVVGQTLFVHLGAVGFDRSKGEIDVEMEARVLDSKGKPLTPQGIRATAHSEDPQQVKTANSVSFNAELSLSRPGDFVLQITMTDRLTTKKVTFETPMRVSE